MEGRPLSQHMSDDHPTSLGTDTDSSVLIVASSEIDWVDFEQVGERRVKPTKSIV